MPGIHRKNSRFARNTLALFLVGSLNVVLLELAQDGGYIGRLTEAILGAAGWTVVLVFLVIFAWNVFESPAFRGSVIFTAVCLAIGITLGVTRDLPTMDGVPLVGRGGTLTHAFAKTVFAAWICGVTAIFYLLLYSLDKAHDNLTSRIETRTAQLEQANRKLQQQIVEREEGENQFRTLADRLEERLNFETLLSELSSMFVNVPVSQIDDRIEVGIRHIVEFLKVDRSSTLEFSPDRRQLYATHSFAVPGISPIPEAFASERLPWYTRRISDGLTTVLQRLPDDLPEAATEEREYCLDRGLKSHLAIPLTVGGSVLGAVVFSAFTLDRDWPEELVTRLRLVGEIFANALERKRSDEALRRSEVRFRRLSETTRAVPWEADAATWQFTYVGPQAVDLLGYPVENWYEDDFWVEHIHPEDKAATVEVCAKQLRVRKDYELVYRMIAADGRVVWLQDIVNVVYKGGEPHLLRGFFIDITDRRILEREILEISAREQRRIGSDLHDGIGQELTGMSLLCKALANDLGKAASPTYPLAKRISQGIDRALDQIRKLARGLIPVAVDPEGLQNALAHLADEAMERKDGLSCRHECSGDLIAIDGDTATQLFLIAQEAVTNAIKHSADAKTLRVSLTSKGGTITLAVSDDGTGFDVQRADGGGLGLKIMDYRARLIGAHLNIISSKDGGTLVESTLERSSLDDTVPISHGISDSTDPDCGRPSGRP